jgi:DNA-binding NtrC family response regulator
MHRPTVLVSSHDRPQCEPVFTLLRTRQCWPVLLSDVDQAVSAIREGGRVGFVILHGPFQFCESFLKFVAEFRSRGNVPPFVVLAIDSSEAFAVAALRAGASDYFAGPLNPATFTKSIERWLPMVQETAVKEGLTGGEVLVGNTPAIQALRANIRGVAATDCNVLITGETGTGKELVAQLIHQNSARSNHPLVCINCAAIPDSLIESELFGYERGAFTGALSASLGKMMTANKGTVFFDEIGDMSPLAQAKILRAIEAKEVQRLGATRRYETDVRILAATHHELDDLSSSQTFRRDLYFRLNVGRIHLTPLRERKADIPVLVTRMLLDLNRRMGAHIEGASEAAVSRLAQYDWPGNVRELKNVMEKIFITRQSGVITTDDLPYPLQTPTLSTSSAGSHAPNQELCSLREALVICNGNKSKAAERLNCSRMTLYRKLAKYRLSERSVGGAIGMSRTDFP